MRHHYEPRRWHAASARVRKTAIYGPAGQIGKFINYLHLNYLISPFFFSLFGPRVGTEPIAFPDLDLAAGQVIF